MNTHSIMWIASAELKKILISPICIVVAAILMILAIVNALGSSILLPNMEADDSIDIFLWVGVSNFYYIISTLLTILAMCIGLLSVSDERSNGSLKTLLTKPVYRKEIIAGKYVGIGIYLLMMIFLTIIIFISSMMLFYREPISIIELVLRIISFIMILFLNCLLTLGIALIIGILTKDLNISLVFSIFYLCFEWFQSIDMLPGSLGNLKLLDPSRLYTYIIIGKGSNNLFDTSLPYPVWFDQAIPYILFMFLEFLILVLISFILFNNEDS